jgi:hypothetical protein
MAIGSLDEIRVGDYIRLNRRGITWKVASEYDTGHGSRYSRSLMVTTFTNSGRRLWKRIDASDIDCGRIVFEREC